MSSPNSIYFLRAYNRMPKHPSEVPMENRQYFSDNHIYNQKYQQALLMVRLTGSLKPTDLVMGLQKGIRTYLEKGMERPRVTEKDSLMD
jgi:hypothetical protein